MTMTRTVGLWIVLVGFVSVLSVPAEARHSWRGGWGGGYRGGGSFTAGLVGGMIGSALASPRYYYPPREYYVPAPAYCAPEYGYPSSSYDAGYRRGYFDGRYEDDCSGTTYPAGRPSYQYNYYNY
jgi:hypothetical protein